MPEKSDNVTVEFVTQESDIPEYITAVNDSGGQITENEKPWDIPPDLLDDYADAQFEPMMVVAVAVSVGFLIKRISDVWLDHKRAGGQIVDTRDKDISVRWASHLERGTLVLVSNDDTRVYKPDNRDEALNVLEKMAVAHG